MRRCVAGVGLLLSVVAARPFLLQAPAELEVRLIDRSSGKPLSARAYLLNTQGSAWTPPGLTAYNNGPEHHFIVPEVFSIQVPPGRYKLTIERGLEYRSSEFALELRAGQRHKEVVRLERWIDMNRRGWYSGDLHNHRRAAEMPALLAAEDLNLAPTIAALDSANQTGIQQIPPERAIRQVDSKHVFSILDRDIDRLSDPHGGLGLLALSSPLPSDGHDSHPPRDELCRLARARGGHIDAQSILGRETAALIALNHIDTVAIVHECFAPHGMNCRLDASGIASQEKPGCGSGSEMARRGMDVYYRLLNVCFRLPVSAGSGSGAASSPLGYSRVYVHVNGSFSYQSWFAALRGGRSFATNGPILFLKVDGAGPGSAISLYQARKKPIKIQVEALSPRPLDRLEIIHNGSVLKAISGSSGSNTLKIEMKKAFDDVGWIAARCFERPERTIRFAHTSPVYLQKGQRARIAREDAGFLLEWIERQIHYYTESEGLQAPEHRQETLVVLNKARRIYEALLRSADRPRRDEGP